MPIYARLLRVLWLFVMASTCTAQITPPDPSQLAALGTSWETSQHASADKSFYEVPNNYSSNLEPGNILKVEYATNLTNYTVPSGLSMSRIIYTTKDINGTTIPASGYILWPYNALPENDTVGYPIAAWAHGTTGLFQPCAPSNYRSLQYHFMVPYLLAMQGIVVVAPDYAGLGVSTLPDGQTIQHAWATAPAQANDIAFAIMAARSAFSQQLKAGGPFVTIGHSEGGRAAWSFAERQANEPIPGYRGTIAFAPAADPIAQVEAALQTPAAPWALATFSIQTFSIAAITAVFPSYKRKGLTDTSAKIFDDIYEPSQGCLPTQNLLFGNLAQDQLARTGWTNDTQVKQWQSLSSVGRKNFAGPLLVIEGEADAVVPYNASTSAAVLSTVKDTCAMLQDDGSTESLELVAYPDMNHFAVIQASQSRWLGWTKDRLSGIAPGLPNGCAIGEASGFRTAHTAQAGALPNFLLEWVNQTFVWQYAL